MIFIETSTYCSAGRVYAVKHVAAEGNTHDKIDGKSASNPVRQSEFLIWINKPQTLTHFACIVQCAIQFYRIELGEVDINLEVELYLCFVETWNKEVVIKDCAISCDACSLPDSLKDTDLSLSCFLNHLKTFLFSRLSLLIQTHLSTLYLLNY